MTEGPSCSCRVLICCCCSVTLYSVKVLVVQSCLTLYDPMDYSLPSSSVCPWSSLGRTGVGCDSLLQGLFPTQGLKPGLLHCRQILYCLSHKGSLPVQEMQETWVQSLGWEDLLEEGMAHHSGILAWKIPWAEEPGGL